MSAIGKFCVRCNLSHNTPKAFLILCCKCQRAWHHTCHIPPVTEDELLQRMEADESERHEEGLRTWSCRRCSKKGAEPKATVTGSGQPSSGPVKSVSKSSSQLFPIYQTSTHVQVAKQVAKRASQVSKVPAILSKSVLAIPSGNVSEYRTAAPPEIDLTGDSLSPPISTHHDLVEIQRSPLSVSSDRDLTDKTVQLPGQTAIREIAQESFQTKSANEEKQAKTVSPIIHPSSKYHQAPQVASLSARRDGRSLSQSHPKPAEQRSPGLNEHLPVVDNGRTRSPTRPFREPSPYSSAIQSRTGSMLSTTSTLTDRSRHTSRQTSYTSASTLQGPSPPPSTRSADPIQYVSATSPISRGTDSPSAPPVVSGDKGKEPMPNFRALVADLRASGRLNDPPMMDYLLNNNMTEPSSADDIMVQTGRPHSPPRSVTRELSAVERGLGEMHVDPCSHDIEDLYGSPVHQRRGSAVGGSRDEQRAGLPDNHDADNVEFNAECFPQLVFQWQELRYAGVGKGQRDDFDHMLANRMARLRISEENTEINTKARRKGHPRHFSKKQRQRKDQGGLDFFIGRWLHDMEAETITVV